MFNAIQQEAELLRLARDQGVISPSLPCFDSIDMRTFDLALALWKPQKQWLKDSQLAPQTQRYSESYYPLRGHHFTAYWWVELARISVPKGSIGFLKSLEQFIDDNEDRFFPTSSEYWGLPYQSDAELSACRWYLRLSNFDGSEPPRFERYLPIPSPNPDELLPGFGYWELPEIQHLWYPPHCAARFPNMIIPGGYSLRLFFYTPPCTKWHWRVMGRMRAVIQSVLCAEADYNSRVSPW